MTDTCSRQGNTASLEDTSQDVLREAAGQTSPTYLQTRFKFSRNTQGSHVWGRRDWVFQASPEGSGGSSSAEPCPASPQLLHKQVEVPRHRLHYCHFSLSIVPSIQIMVCGIVIQLLFKKNKGRKKKSCHTNF